MEYSISTVLMLTITIMVADGDESDGSYETNYLGSSDLNYKIQGSEQGYQEGQGYEQGYQSGDGYEQGYQGGHGYEPGYKRGHGYEKGDHGKDYYAEPHYAFAYEVHDDHTGDIKAHKEERKGDHTRGMYMLVDPNGSKRIVEYVVQGKSGFNAKVHQSKPQKPHGSHGGHAGGHTGHGYPGGHSGQSGYSGGHTGHSGFAGGSVGYSTGGHAGYGGYTGEHVGQSGYAVGHTGQSGYSEGLPSYGSFTGKQPGQNSYSGGSHATSLGDYAKGYYTSYKQPPYKVQEEVPNYNYKPLISYKPTFNLQPFKPSIPYATSESQHPKDSSPYSKPLIALYRPQASYKPISLNKPVSYKFTRAHKQDSRASRNSQSNQGHAISSVSFSSHGSKIASSTNHVVPQQKIYENKH